MDIVYSFFEAFGIKPKYRYRELGNCHSDIKACTTYCKEYTRYDFCTYYPPITPEIVLNLQVILCNFHSEHECCLLITGNSIENITINILKDCIELKDYIQSEVLTLFSK